MLLDLTFGQENVDYSQFPFPGNRTDEKFSRLNRGKKDAIKNPIHKRTGTIKKAEKSKSQTKPMKKKTLCTNNLMV